MVLNGIWILINFVTVRITLVLKVMQVDPLSLFFTSIGHHLIIFIITTTIQACGRYFLKQVAQLSQRDRAAGWVSYGQKWKT